MDNYRPMWQGQKISLILNYSQLPCRHAQHAFVCHVYLLFVIIYNTGNFGYHWYLCSSAQEWSWQSPHSRAGLCDIIFVQHSSVSCLHASTDHFLSSWGKVSLSCEDGNSWNTKPGRDKRRLNNCTVELFLPPIKLRTPCHPGYLNRSQIDISSLCNSLTNGVC